MLAFCRYQGNISMSSRGGSNGVNEPSFQAHAKEFNLKNSE
ncbi:hypothetical protein BT93_L1780 [Corymbia citriodora subsp. variegata]|uniref:Uncharacterized protein n=1 Tax=Corymbia citriodora subsp. variegata TaxID=360336 RepID=A0A8T0CM31_CORYI|nr:hypothetical protein BT93_L1780 [Corymbia citriodora subsp. variegata]